MTLSGAASSRMLFLAPANPGLLTAVARLLERVDDLGPGATGALHFPGEGVILVESRRICWAMARSMRVRLTDILRSQTTPPLPREAIESIYRRCKSDGTRLGESLVASGLVSEAGLRAALFKHSGEAIAALARSGVAPQAFIEHARAGYDPRFAFSPCEVLGMLGALDDLARGTAAQLELQGALVDDTTGAAFARSTSGIGVQLIAVQRGCGLAAGDLIGLCRWVAGLFDVAGTVDPSVVVARVTWRGELSVIAWQHDEVGYVAVTSSRAASARLLSRLAERVRRRESGPQRIDGRDDGGSP